MVLFVLKGGGYLLRYLQLETTKIVKILNWGDEKLSRYGRVKLSGVDSRAVATGGLGSSAPPPKKINCKLAIICEV